MQWPIVGKGTPILSVVLGVLTFAGPATADPFSFKHVTAVWTVGHTHPSTVVRVDLFALSPPALSGTVFGPEGDVFIGFDVPVFGVLPPGGSDTLRATYGLPPNFHPDGFDIRDGFFVQEFQIDKYNPLPHVFPLGMILSDPGSPSSPDVHVGLRE